MNFCQIPFSLLPVLFHIYQIKCIKYNYVGEKPVLVYSSLRQIKVLNLVSHGTYILVDQLKQATGLAIDGINIYWTIIYEGMQAIVRAKKIDFIPEIIVSSGKYIQYNNYKSLKINC